MKCSLCGTENKYVRVLFVSLECTNVTCRNYSAIAAKEKDSGTTSPEGTGEITESEDDQLDWADVFIDPGGYIS